MRKLIKDVYLIALWWFCGGGIYTLFRSVWPSTRMFWDDWAGGAIITVLAVVLIWPAGAAFVKSN
jgi:hypothetical protein